MPAASRVRREPSRIAFYRSRRNYFDSYTHCSGNVVATPAGVVVFDAATHWPPDLDVGPASHTTADIRIGDTAAVIAAVAADDVCDDACNDADG